MKNKTTKYFNENIDKILKKLYKKEEITFEEFLTLLDANMEIEFYYNDKHFGITEFAGFEIYEWNKEETYMSFKSLNDFVNFAKIDGVLLKDHFDEIKNMDVM